MPCSDIWFLNILFRIVTFKNHMRAASLLAVLKTKQKKLCGIRITTTLLLICEILELVRQFGFWLRQGFLSTTSE